MKRLAFALLVMALAVPLALCEDADGIHYANQSLSLRPGDVWTIQDAPGEWESDAPEVVSAENGVLTALDEGFATVSCEMEDGGERRYDVTVDASAPPALIQGAIRLALGEWEENLGKTFTQRNKYTAWYCGTGPGCYFGWCGGFVSYCLDTAGVPMDEYNESVPHPGGEPYAVFAAGVGKLWTGYNKMERITNVPRKGYLVIYGQRDYTTVIHIGMITDVRDRGDGVYELSTVEGNVSSRIKRYRYLYDSGNADEHNMAALPDDERTDDVYQYELHQKNWYVYAICQTWF